MWRRTEKSPNKNNLTALLNIGYSLHVVTSNDGKKDNGLIVNTVSQVTNTPNQIAVCMNKQDYPHHIIKQTGVMNVSCLSVKHSIEGVSIRAKFGNQRKPMKPGVEPKVRFFLCEGVLPSATSIYSGKG